MNGRREEFSVNSIKKEQLINGQQQLAEVLKVEQRVVALIYATWCPFCMRFLPVFQRYAQERPDFRLVCDDREAIADLYDIDVVPAILVFENGKVARRLDGIIGIGLTEKQLADFVTGF
jgi:thiol-disulfide isomerase/thioredoxin